MRPLYVQRNGDLPDRKNTYYDDYYSLFVQYFVNNTEGFAHLIRPRKEWKAPSLYEANIRYSRISEEHQRYMQRRKARRPRYKSA